MKVLVTGGAGFIGSHLCEALLDLGYEVTALDNLITGSLENIRHLQTAEGFHFYEHDVVKPFPDSPPVRGWDTIFHLASPASPMSYNRYPLETLLTNSLGTYHALEAARTNGAKFLLASTSEVYGDPKEHPQPETYWGNVNPVGPRSCYDEGKRFAEAITMTYVKTYSLDGRIVRIFNTYGPRNHPEDGRMIPTFVTQAITGKPITVHGDGEQTRSLCYVKDLVEGLILAVEAPGTRGEVINLGNPEEHKVKEYARMITELTGSASPIEYTAPREEEIERRKPDISKARKLLGWQPTNTLETGLRATISWVKTQLALRGQV